MELIVVLIGGLLAGLIARGMVPDGARGGIGTDVLVGVLGGFLGKAIVHFAHVPLPMAANAWILHFDHFRFSMVDVFWNLLVAVVGAVILLLVYRALTGGTTPRASTV